jgi:hypothetical protein
VTPLAANQAEAFRQSGQKTMARPAAATPTSTNNSDACLAGRSPEGTTLKSENADPEGEEIESRKKSAGRQQH